MSPASRAALIARAKSLAIPVASCVAASIRPGHILAARSRNELMALVIVLAEAADPVRLRGVVQADDGAAPALPSLSGHRNAGQIAQYAWLRREGKDIGVAAAELGVTKRTAERYEASLRDAGGALWREARDAAA